MSKLIQNPNPSNPAKNAVSMGMWKWNFSSKTKFYKFIFITLISISMPFFPHFYPDNGHWFYYLIGGAAFWTLSIYVTFKNLHNKNIKLYHNWEMLHGPEKAKA